MATNYLSDEHLYIFHSVALKIIKIAHKHTYQFPNYICVRSKRYIFSKDTNKLGVLMSAKRLSKKDFEVFLHALFDNETLKVKYQKPDAWRKQPSKK